jgi:hypothetical protein
MEKRTSTPLPHTYNVPVHYRFSEFELQSDTNWANRPFSSLNSDDKLLRIFQQLEKLDDLDPYSESILTLTLIE